MNPNGNMSLLFGFSGVKIERKIYEIIVSFRIFGKPNLGFYWGIIKYSNYNVWLYLFKGIHESTFPIFRSKNRKKNKDIIRFFSYLRQP